MCKAINAIYISTLNNTHMTVFPKVLKLMKKKGLEKVLLTGGLI